MSDHYTFRFKKDDRKYLDAQDLPFLDYLEKLDSRVKELETQVCNLMEKTEGDTTRFLTQFIDIAVASDKRICDFISPNKCVCGHHFYNEKIPKSNI